MRIVNVNTHNISSSSFLFYVYTDVSAKQHYRRRKEPFQSEYSNSGANKQINNNNKYRNNTSNNNFYNDKRPAARKNSAEQQNGIAVNIANGATAGLMDEYELNSVFNQGSKKQNLNHLLNFHKYDDMQHNGAFSKHGYHHHRNTSKKYQYNKEQYLQANCQFIVKEDVMYDYKPFKLSPDALVEWDQVEKVLISSVEESQCPICLYPPRAAKITRCGHVYCYSCILHYLSLSDKTWRKCPICYDSIYLADLKSTTSKHIHHSYKVGDTINMELMNREKGSLFVNKANDNNNQITDFPNFSDVKGKFTYSKLIMANKMEIIKIIEKEKHELDFQLAEDGFDCPENVFVHRAVELLNIKQREIEKLIDEETQISQFNEIPVENSTATAPHCLEESINSCSSSVNDMPITTASTTDDDESSNVSIIDDDCNLTVHDIDILPETTNLQSKHFYFYQAPNAQNIFLHSFNSKMLQLQYGSLENSPQTICGKIVQIECCTMNEDLRKRLKYLQHLPFSTVFEVVEIEFKPKTVSGDVLDIFRGKQRLTS